uniref:Uncharacterized protein n=1 Tax=Podarcis muralis TaxID=64176 RepID=A0A670HYH1_PODMU
MDVDKYRKRFQSEVTCCVCLSYFTRPVELGCGHNFCKTCILRCWEESGERTRCPECRTVVEKDFRQNRLLADLVGREARKRRSECQRHQQPLDLFCEDDRVPFCGDCAGPQEHRGHRVVSAEEAVQAYKVRMSGGWEWPLQGSNSAHKSVQWHKDLGDCKYKFGSKHPILFLSLDQVRGILCPPDAESQKREEHLDRLSRDLIPLETLILEMEKRLQRPTSEKTLKCITWQQLDYDSCSLLFVPPPHKKTPIAKVTLDPETAHPQLILSADGLSVTCGDMREEVPDNPKRFNQLTVVLGREAFTEGRYSWEVTVGNEEEWALGVARKSVRRKGMFNFTPQEGVWAMGKWRGQYRALSDNPYHLHPSGELRRIRVTLNYTGQRVAFFDVDRGIALLAFAGGSFSGEDLLPFFCCFWTTTPIIQS